MKIAAQWHENTCKLCIAANATCCITPMPLATNVTSSMQQSLMKPPKFDPDIYFASTVLELS
jgi:hypothetical protein